MGGVTLAYIPHRPELSIQTAGIRDRDSRWIRERRCSNIVSGDIGITGQAGRGWIPAAGAMIDQNDELLLRAGSVDPISHNATHIMREARRSSASTVNGRGK